MDRLVDQLCELAGIGTVERAAVPRILLVAHLARLLLTEPGPWWSLARARFRLGVLPWDRPKLLPPGGGDGEA